MQYLLILPKGEVRSNSPIKTCTRSQPSRRRNRKDASRHLAGMENNDAHQCGTAQGQKGPDLQDFLDVCGEWTLPPNGTHSMFRTLLFPRETTATRNCNMQRGLATNVSADKGSLARPWPWMPWMSRDIPGLPWPCSNC
jgi:hypothetical protein